MKFVFPVREGRRCLDVILWVRRSGLKRNGDRSQVASAMARKGPHRAGGQWEGRARPGCRDAMREK